MTHAKRLAGTRWEKTRQIVLRRDPDVCAICGKPGMANSIDHIVPLSLGGAPYDPGNLRRVHGACNSARRDGRRGQTATSRTWW